VKLLGHHMDGAGDQLRIQHKIDQGAVSLAVVVQELVLAEAAGILFTANRSMGIVTKC
jgi:phosphoenolpyruvate synthase/pyruvate phosphate dikinase